MKKERQTKDKLIKRLKSIVYKLKDQYNVDLKEVLNLIKETTIELPTSIFSKELGALETVCRYLKDELNLTFSDISILINRDERTVWSSYKNSLQKRKEKLRIEKSEFYIPISILKDRNLSTLETIVGYLKEEFKLSHHEIALLLKRDDRTVWTVYSRFKKKRGEYAKK